jgi:hypothetical protein
LLLLLCLTGLILRMHHQAKRADGERRGGQNC